MAVLHLRYSDSSANSTAVITYNQSIKTNATYANVSYSTGGQCLQLRTSTGTSAIVSYPITTGTTSRGLNFHLSNTASTWHIGSSTLTTLDTVFGTSAKVFSFASTWNTATPLSSITLPGMSYTYPVYSTTSSSTRDTTTTSSFSSSTSTSSSVHIFYSSKISESYNEVIVARSIAGYSETEPFVGNVIINSNTTGTVLSSLVYSNTSTTLSYSVSSFYALLSNSTKMSKTYYSYGNTSGANTYTTNAVTRSTSALSKAFSYSNTWSAPCYLGDTNTVSTKQTWTFRAAPVTSLSTYVSALPVTSLLNTSYPLFVVSIAHDYTSRVPKLVAFNTYGEINISGSNVAFITGSLNKSFSTSNNSMLYFFTKTSNTFVAVFQGKNSSWTNADIMFCEYYDALPYTATFQPTACNSTQLIARWPSMDFDGYNRVYCPRALVGETSLMTQACGVSTLFGWNVDIFMLQFDNTSTFSMYRGRCGEKRDALYSLVPCVSQYGTNTFLSGSISSTHSEYCDMASTTEKTYSSYTTTSGVTSSTSQKSSTSPITVYQWPASSSNATSWNTATATTLFSINTTLSYRTAIASYKTASLYNHYNSHILVTRTTFGSATYTNQQSVSRAASQDVYTPISITMITNTTNGTKSTALAPSNTSVATTTTGTWITTYNNYVSTTTVTFSVSRRLVSQAVVTSVPKITISSRNYSGGSFTTTLQTSAIRYARATAKTTTRTVSAPYISTSVTKAYTI